MLSSAAHRDTTQDDTAAAAEVGHAVEGLTYPLICKHYSGGGSVGMGRDCVVSDLEALVRQVRKFVGEYGGALVEEFVEGREFSVLVGGVGRRRWCVCVYACDTTQHTVGWG